MSTETTLFSKGLHLADASVFISCVMTLATFDITKASENGQLVEPKAEYTTGTIRSAYTSRREMATHLIRVL